MTDYVGYLVRDRDKHSGLFQDLYSCDFSPVGILAVIAGWPGDSNTPTKRKEFIEKATSLYDQLTKRGYKDIAMAMTLDSGAFEGFETMYMDKEASPQSFDDWLALKEIHKENQRREDEYLDKHGSGLGKIKGHLRGDKYRSSVRPKGVLAVARIRSDAEDASKDRVEL